MKSLTKYNIMNLKTKNLLLMGSIVASFIFSSCEKDEDSFSEPSDEINAPSNETGTFIDNRDNKDY